MILCLVIELVKEIKLERAQKAEKEAQDDTNVE